jgi:hypothetical protein
MGPQVVQNQILALPGILLLLFHIYISIVEQVFMDLKVLVLSRKCICR